MPDPANDPASQRSACSHRRILNALRLTAFVIECAMSADEPKRRARTFYWRWLKTAVTGAWGITSVAATISGIVLAVVVSTHWANDTAISQLNVIGNWILPVTIFSSIFVARLLLAPYWLWREMADKVARAELTTPHIIVIPLKSTVRSKVAVDHTGNVMASVDVTLRLENDGPGEAHNYEIAVYSCWLKDPTEWDKWADQFFARWPIGAAVEYGFSRSKIAEDQGGGRDGFSISDELVFVVEVKGRLNAAEGKIFENEQIWLRWEARHADRIVPPNAAMVKWLQPHLARFKASIPKWASRC
jgi:hypothetical protein